MSIILEEVKKNENFLFPRIDYKKNRPQIDINIDKNKTSDLGISNLEIGRTLEILLAGRKVNTYIENGEEYYVILQAIKEKEKTIMILGPLKLKLRMENLLD